MAWSNEVIRSLESLLLVCTLKDPPLEASVAKAKLVEIAFETAVLVERGRLFFKNEVLNRYGSEKQPAYRGYRPEILDQIVVAHQIACAFGSADNDSRLRMLLIAEDCLKRFVSLAQKEVGRSRTVSADTSKGGDGTHLPQLMRDISPQRIASLRGQK